jgi:hypothetical protein
MVPDEHTLEFLLAFDGRVHHLEHGYWLKFEIKRVAPTPQRPHGLRYSFTLHDPEGTRLIGFDNAHGVPRAGSRFRKQGERHDHWHRFADDSGVSYSFTTAEQLLSDFETAVTAELARRNVGRDVLGESGIEEEEQR